MSSEHHSKIDKAFMRLAEMTRAGRVKWSKSLLAYEANYKNFTILVYPDSRQLGIENLTRPDIGPIGMPVSSDTFASLLASVKEATKPSAETIKMVDQFIDRLLAD